MMSGRLVSSARVLHRISARSASLHVGPNVQLRRCDKQPLENVNVTVLHNGARAVVLARELVARGARVTHFVKEGSQVPDVEGQGIYVNLDCASSRSELVASLKGADVFVDSSTKGVGMAPKDVLKVNARLIYSSVQADPSEASSMRALADIACALYGREKTSVGQVLTPVERSLDSGSGPGPGSGSGTSVHHHHHTDSGGFGSGLFMGWWFWGHGHRPNHTRLRKPAQTPNAGTNQNPGSGTSQATGAGTSPAPVAEPSFTSGYDTNYSNVPGVMFSSGSGSFHNPGYTYDTSYRTVPGSSSGSSYDSGSDWGSDSGSDGDGD